MFYRFIIKPILFTISAEKAHHISISLFTFLTSAPLISSLIKFIFKYEHPHLAKEVFGIKFPNPVGLAAGFDKEGKYYKAMSALGFGFIEIGTVTPLPQKGNPQPRLFRLPKDKALINRMGFNNEGVEAMVNRLKADKKRKVIIGGNIGKNKLTDNDKANEDYKICFEKLYPHVDYFVVNVSSPNTPDLRSLQDKIPLNNLLALISQLRSSKNTYKPVLLKIAPDLNHAQIDDVLQIVEMQKIDGIIATNTTISREGLKSDENIINALGNGGLSGQPLLHKSIDVINYLRMQNKSIPIIGVGGINSTQD
ncbi:MAG: quinone-dependent dihydroorotate dehydrogenase, partial [Ignavibacteria bacterium]|nr:quinone-dependent dihydroorotate dehydrogenase [Ignavibacteria bacterium]